MFFLRKKFLSPELGFPGHSIVKIHSKCRTCRFNPGLKSLEERKCSHSSILCVGVYRQKKKDLAGLYYRLELDELKKLYVATILS